MLFPMTMTFHVNVIVPYLALIGIAFPLLIFGELQLKIVLPACVSFFRTDFVLAI